MSAIDRLFNNLAGIGNDSCDLTNKNKQKTVIPLYENGTSSLIVKILK